MPTIPEVKNAIEIIKKSHPFSTKYPVDEEAKALQTLLSLAQSVVEAKCDFEDYLMEIHGKQYIGTDDCMPDDFNKWVQDLGADELIEYADKYYRLYLAKKMAGMEEVERNPKECVGCMNTLICRDYDLFCKGMIRQALQKWMEE